MIEIWKTIPGYEGLYMVSNLGRVKSMEFYRSKRGILSQGNDKLGYKRVVLYKNDSEKTLLVHRIVASAFFGLKNDEKIDHIDGNPENNTIKNLRVCSQAENIRNSKSHRDGSSKFKGVFWDKQKNKWGASLCFNYKRVFRKFFSNELEAAKAYDNEAIKYFGNFAKLNFPV